MAECSGAGQVGQGVRRGGGRGRAGGGGAASSAGEDIPDPQLEERDAAGGQAERQQGTVQSARNAQRDQLTLVTGLVTNLSYIHALQYSAPRV